jgi:hypothetical protein
VRQGAAWSPAERPSSCLAVQQAVSRAGRWPHRRAVMVAECRECRPSNMVRRPSGVVVPGCPDAHCALAALSASPSASTCPASARPVPDVRYVSSVPRVQRPPVQCPASGTCPASARLVSARPISSAVSASSVQCERPASVSTLSAPVSSWSAWVRQAATRLETGRPGNYLTVEACLKTGLTA